jgi:hypothetical protein
MTTETAFTGVRDVDVRILADLDDVSLNNACQVNTYVRSICKDERLWIEKINKQFPGEIKNLRGNQDPEELYYSLAGRQYFGNIRDNEVISHNAMPNITFKQHYLHFNEVNYHNIVDSIDSIDSINLDKKTVLRLAEPIIEKDYSDVWAVFTNNIDSSPRANSANYKSMYILSYSPVMPGRSSKADSLLTLALEKAASEGAMNIIKYESDYIRRAFDFLNEYLDFSRRPINVGYSQKDPDVVNVIKLIDIAFEFEHGDLAELLIDTITEETSLSDDHVIELIDIAIKYGQHDLAKSFVVKLPYGKAISNYAKYVSDEQIKEMHKILPWWSPPINRYTSSASIPQQQFQPAITPQQFQPAIIPQQFQPAITPQQFQPAITPQQFQPAITPQQFQPAITPQQFQPTITPQQQQFLGNQPTPIGTPQRVQNPKTNRMINVGGQVYKNLIKEGYVLQNGILVK